MEKVTDSFRKPGVRILHELGAWEEGTVEKFDTLSRAEKVAFLLSHTHNTLGRCALLLDEPGQAEEHFFAALEKGRPVGDPALLVPVLSNYQSSLLNLQPQRNPSVRPPPESVKLLAEPEDARPVQKLYARLNALLTRFVTEKEDMVIDDYPVFHKEDPFLSGKLLMGMAYWVDEMPIGHPLTAWRCQRVKECVPFLLKMPCKSWGVFFFLRALLYLKDRGLLDACFSPEAFQTARDLLHWEDFVDPTSHRLIRKPNNFYQVAFAIALYRFQLGWDRSDALYIFLERMLTHIEEVSQDSGFADETEGEGRFDRYSVLFVAEICHRLREAGLPLPEKIKPWLRNCAELALFHVNPEGHGFCYGRSIGAYGETAFLEVLAAAAWAGVLSDEEKSAAFLFSRSIQNRFLTHWWDASKQSVDLWSQDQGSDSYRGKFRILGENLSLLHQHIYTAHLWEDLGFNREGTNVVSTLAEKLPHGRFIQYGSSPNEDHQYGAYFWRHRNRHVIALPLINGGLHHRHSVYLPIPQCPLFTFPKAQDTHPYLLPTFIFANGEEGCPTTFYQNIRSSFDKAGRGILEWDSPCLILIGEEHPKKLKAPLTVHTRMEFAADSLVRTDSVHIADAASANLAGVRLSLPNTFVESKSSGEARIWEVHEEGISRFEARGYFDLKTSRPPSPPQREAPHSLTLSWKLTFN
ncbi:MAG: hypothetical protein JJT96_17810 [Opitutales bacterium]|nr:hypothetical protein [Opitutales bacterium]